MMDQGGSILVTNSFSENIRNYLKKFVGISFSWMRILSMLRRRLAYNGLLPSFVNKASMFTAQRDNYIKVKKISIIRNDTPPSL